MQCQKAPKELPNCLKGSRNKRRANCFFYGVLLTSALILQPFLTVDQLNQVSLKTISWSVNALDCSNRTSVGLNGLQFNEELKDQHYNNYISGS